MNGYIRRIKRWKLSRVELRKDSIESLWMNGFKLRGIDLPLIPVTATVKSQIFATEPDIELWAQASYMAYAIELI